jgi:hypothetical protein
MKRRIILFIVAALCCQSVWAQEGNFQYKFSPKLQQFLMSHPDARQVLTNVTSETFSNKLIQIYYFYTDDESTPKAFHYYPTETVVGIGVRENLQPLDEFTCLTFEAINAQGEKRFREICQMAGSGQISRSDFAQEILKQEFKAAKKARDLLKGLKLGKKEKTGASAYENLLGCPDKFEDFLIYTKKVSSADRDPIEEYEKQYDSLRRSQ